MIFSFRITFKLKCKTKLALVDLTYFDIAIAKYHRLSNTCDAQVIYLNLSCFKRCRSFEEWFGAGFSSNKII